MTELSLCDDVLQHIFTFLPTKDLISSRQVCKRWKNIITEIADFEVTCEGKYFKKTKKIFPKTKISTFYCKKSRDFTDEGDHVIVYEYRLSKDNSLLYSQNIPSIVNDFIDDGKLVSRESICCLLYTSPSPRDGLLSRMPSSA